MLFRRATNESKNYWRTIYIDCGLLPGFIGGPFARDFVIWPILIGLIYTLYCQWKYGNVFYECHKFKKYIIAYIVILFTSLVWGLIIYPYWNMFFNETAMNNSKFAAAFVFINRLGLNIDENTVLSLWLAMKFVKSIIHNIFIEIFCSFF